MHTVYSSVFFCFFTHDLKHYCLHIFHVRIEGNTPSSSQPDGNRMWGEDAWIGRRVQKSFEGFGSFKGTVVDADDWEGHPGHRLFQVKYDDGDSAWLGVDSLLDILLPLQPDSILDLPVQVCRQFCRLKHLLS